MDKKLARPDSGGRRSGKLQVEDPARGRVLAGQREDVCDGDWYVLAGGGKSRNAGCGGDEGRKLGPEPKGL